MRKKVSVFFMIISGFVLLFWVFGGLFVFVFGFFSPLDTENWYTSTFFYYFRYIFGFFLSFHGLDMGFQKVMQKFILVNSPVITCISNSLKILQSLECYWYQTVDLAIPFLLHFPFSSHVPCRQFSESLLQHALELWHSWVEFPQQKHVQLLELC